MTQGIVEIDQKEFVLSSLEVATMTEKDHSKLLRDIRGYAKIIEDSPNLDSRNFFIEDTYVNSQNKNQPCYLVTKKGCDMIANKMTGKKGILFTAEYVTKFEQMQESFVNSLATPVKMYSYMIDDPIKRAEQWIEEEKERQSLYIDNNKKEKLLLEQKPKVDFANAAEGCKNAILIRQLAKILVQAGVKNCGERRLFESLRQNNYLIKKVGSDYNMPTQKSLDAGLFSVKSTVISNSSSGTMSYTTKVTQKGVQYFLEKYINGELKL